MQRYASIHRRHKAANLFSELRFRQIRGNSPHEIFAPCISDPSRSRHPRRGREQRRVEPGRARHALRLRRARRRRTPLPGTPAILPDLRETREMALPLLLAQRTRPLPSLDAAPFDVDCGGIRVPWIRVAEASSPDGRAWVEHGRMSLGLGPARRAPREERMARRRWWWRNRGAYPADERERFDGPSGPHSEWSSCPPDLRRCSARARSSSACRRAKCRPSQGSAART